MRFRVLGPVEIETAGRILAIPRRRERCLLGVLLLELERVVSVDRLAELLWDGDPPERARRTIHGHLSRIRALLATSGAAERGIEVVTVGSGYRMRGDPDAVDAHRFRVGVDEARRLPDPAGRVERLRRALDLWRGPALDNAATDWLRHRLCAELHERRLAATEDLMSTSLALGRERAILPELARVAAEHPGRERLVELHMRALYQAGRKVDALDAYSRARAYLTEELGLEPGPVLRELHRSMLRDEVSPITLDPEARSGGAARLGASSGPGTDPTGADERRTPAPPALDVVPRHLPADVAGFAGRESELERLDAVAARGGGRPGAVVIAGTAGVGKTALALHWAHRVAGRFPDGQLYVNLRGFDPGGSVMDPAEAIRAFLDAFDVPAQRVPADLDAQAGLYRSLLASRRVLVVVDNARDPGQVRPLLPGAPGCLALVTSRNQLSGLLAAEGAHPLTLDLLTQAEAHDLLENRLGPQRVTAEPEAAEEIIARCARLPLALAIVAARAATHPGFPLHALAAELHDTGGLDAFTGGDPGTDARAVFSWSYHTLGPEAARLFRLLGLHPGPDLTAPAAASLTALARDRTKPLIDELTRAHLLTEHTPGRFGFHDLLRGYAGELVASGDSAAARRAGLGRLLDHYVHTAHAAAMRLNPYRHPIAPAAARPGAVIEEVADLEQALAWFRAEHPVLVAATERAAAAGFDGHACQLAWALRDFLQRQGHWHDEAATQHTALQAARRQGDRAGQAHTHRDLARAHARLGRFDDAHAHLSQALALAGELGGPAGQADIHGIAGVVCEQQGQHARALEHSRQALELYRDIDHRSGQSRALNAVGWYHALLGDYHQALAHCQHALELLHHLHDPNAEAGAWDSLGYAHHHLGHHRQAIDCYQRALTLCQQLGDRYYEAATLIHLGETNTVAGRPRAAHHAWRHALDILDQLDHPDADHVRARLHQPAQR